VLYVLSVVLLGASTAKGSTHTAREVSQRLLACVVKGGDIMADLEESLSIALKASCFKMVSSTGYEVIEICHLDLNKTEAATLAWLVNQPADTLIKVEFELN